MKTTKTLVTVLAALTLALGQVTIAGAVPLQQAGTTSVTLITVTPTYELDGTTVNGYDVSYSYEGGYTGTVHLTIQDAYNAGMLQDDGTGTTWATGLDGNPVLIVGPGDTVALLTELVGSDPCALPDGASQPVGEALTGFFCGSQGVSYDTIMAWRASGYGFGVIGQALFMAQALGSTDPTLVGDILAAKQSKDFSTLMTEYDMPDNVTNWGQLKKWVMMDELKSMTNLGAIMSGRATPLVGPTTTTTTTTTSNTPSLGNGHGKGKANGHGKDKGH